MEFGALILAYRQFEYIEYCLEALDPHMDCIVVMYSEMPWVKYNPNARESFGGDDGTIDILNKPRWRGRGVDVIKGVWDVEEDMRNEGVERLEQKKIDWLHVIDADEFYPDGMIPRLQSYVTHYCDNLASKCLWAARINHYRRFDTIIDPVSEGPDRIEVLFKLGLGTRFADRRIVGAQRFNLPDEFHFHHLGFVLGEDRMWEKIHTWGHANEVLPYWYQEKWKKWTPGDENLCKRVPGRWSKTRLFNLEQLPTVLHKHPFFKSP